MKCVSVKALSIRLDGDEIGWSRGLGEKLEECRTQVEESLSHSTTNEMVLWRMKVRKMC